MKLHKVVVSLLLSAVAVSAVMAEDLRKVAEQHEREFVKAMKAKDIGWFKRIAAPDYVEIGMTGTKMNREAAIKQMDQMFSTGHVNTLTTKILKVTKTKNGMKVLVAAHMVATMPMGGPKPSKMNTHMQFEETWAKTNGKWLIHKLRSISEKTLVDGKPMKMD